MVQGGRNINPQTAGSHFIALALSTNPCLVNKQPYANGRRERKRSREDGRRKKGEELQNCLLGRPSLNFAVQATPVLCR